MIQTAAVLLAFVLGIVVLPPLGVFLYRRLTSIPNRFDAKVPLEVNVNGTWLTFKYTPPRFRKSREIRSPGIEVLIACPADGTFSIHLVGSEDTPMAKLGFTRAREFLPDSENKFIIYSSDPKAMDRLLDSSDFQRRIQSLIQQGVTDFRHDGNFLSLGWFPYRGEGNQQALAFLKRAVKPGKALGQLIPGAFAGGDRVRSLKRWRWRTFISQKTPVWMGSLTLPVVVVVAAVGWALFPPAEWNRAIGFAFGAALAGSFAGVLMARLVGRGYALPGQQASRLLSLFVLTGSVMGSGSLIWANGLFDGGQSTVYEVPVVYEHIPENKEMAHLVRVPSWKDNGERLEFEVPAGALRKLGSIGPSAMVLTVKPGRFGMEWIVSKEVADTKKTDKN